MKDLSNEIKRIASMMREALDDERLLAGIEAGGDPKSMARHQQDESNKAAIEREYNDAMSRLKGAQRDAVEVIRRAARFVDDNVNNRDEDVQDWVFDVASKAVRKNVVAAVNQTDHLVDALGGKQSTLEILLASEETAKDILQAMGELYDRGDIGLENLNKFRGDIKDLVEYADPEVPGWAHKFLEGGQMKRADLEHPDIEHGRQTGYGGREQRERAKWQNDSEKSHAIADRLNKMDTPEPDLRGPKTKALDSLEDADAFLVSNKYGDEAKKEVALHWLKLEPVEAVTHTHVDKVLSEQEILDAVPKEVRDKVQLILEGHQNI